MTIDVFLSVGRPATDEQEAFVKEIELLLQEHDLNPLSLGRNYYSAAQPLQAVEELMDRCAGCVVIAFERLYVESGVERRGSQEAKLIVEQGVTTVWNQIEAAMAYVKGHPLLVIVEKGIVQQGLLSHGADWHVQQVPLDPARLRSPETVGRLKEWKGRVVARAEAPASAPAPAVTPAPAPTIEKLTVGQIVGAMTPAQLWAAILGAAGAITSAFLLGTRI
jgi:hypothetical protein